MWFKLEEDDLLKAVDFALKSTADIIKSEIIDITPRHKIRLPEKTINRKDWIKPIRRKAHYKPVKIFWDWYSWVSWNLKKSIENEKNWRFSYKIWVVKWPTSNYARYLEYWTKNMEPRSFLRKWLYDNSIKAKKTFIKAFKLYLKRKSWKK